MSPFLTETQIRFLPSLLWQLCDCTGVCSEENKNLKALKLRSGKILPFIHICINYSKWGSASLLQICLYHGGNAQLVVLVEVMLDLRRNSLVVVVVVCFAVCSSDTQICASLVLFKTQASCKCIHYSTACSTVGLAASPKRLLPLWNKRIGSV